jgi:hypothetical protein
VIANILSCASLPVYMLQVYMDFSVRSGGRKHVGPCFVCYVPSTISLTPLDTGSSLGISFLLFSVRDLTSLALCVLFLFWTCCSSVSGGNNHNSQLLCQAFIICWPLCNFQNNPLRSILQMGKLRHLKIKTQLRESKAKIGQ